MHRLMILIMLTVTFCDYLSDAQLLSGPAKFLPEALTAVVILVVLFKGLRQGLGLIPAKYWFVFGFLAVVILCGLATNNVGPGPLLSSMRHYLRAIPLFFLPAVADFTEKQLRQQMKIVVGLGLLQAPFAIYQRYIVMSEGRWSGDSVKGTLLDSGILSIVLICIAVVLTAFLIRGLVRKWPFLPVFFGILLPTTINETKVTAILVPFGLLTMLAAAAPAGKRVQMTLGSLALLGAFAAVFLPVYEAMNANSPYKSKSLVEFFSNEQQLNSYLVGKKEVGFGAKHMVTRGAAIKFPLQYLARDPAHLAFGLGMGNASYSALGTGYTGSYADLFNNFVVSAAAQFLLEIGVLGSSLVFLLSWLVFTDAWAVARADNGMMGALAAGWVGVAAIMAVSLFYNTVHVYPFPSYLYWYFSGVIATQRMRLVLAKAQPISAGRTRIAEALGRPISERRGAGTE